MKGGIPSPESGSAAAQTRVLFVSNLPKSTRGADVTDGRFGPDIEVVDFTSVSEALLRDFDPHFVVSPILTPGFDIVDLAFRLWQLRFEGAYRVLTEAPLPNPGLVLREVRAQCPGLDIDLLSMETLRG